MEFGAGIALCSTGGPLAFAATTPTAADPTGGEQVTLSAPPTNDPLA